MKQLNVIAFGGLGGHAFSAGLKTILLRLRPLQGADKPIDFVTFEDWSSWRQWGMTLQTWSDATILLGHSFGVTAMFGAARRLTGEKPPIPLAIAFDPSQYWRLQVGLAGSGGNAAPDRIGRVINFYQQGFPIGNQRVFRDDGTGRGIDNRLVGNISHGGIEDRPELQQAVIDEIRKEAEALNREPAVA